MAKRKPSMKLRTGDSLAPPTCSAINTHHQQRDDHRQKTERIQEEAPAFTDEYDGKACDGWPDDARAIEDRGIQRDGVGQILLADHMNKKGLSNGNVEGVHDADQKGDEDQLPGGNDMGQREDRQNECQNHRERLGGDYAAMPVVAIADVAAHPREAQHGNLAGESKNTQKAAEPVSL